MNRTLVRSLLVCALVALIALPALARGPIEGPVETDISIAATTLESTQNVEVTFNLTNTSDRTLHLLKWNLPLDGVEGNYFDVVRNGERVPYLGRIFKRAAPEASDYMVLWPGQSLSTVVELSASYDMRYTGEYSVRFRGEDLEHTPNKAHRAQLIDLTSNEIYFWIDGTEAPLRESADPLLWGRAKPAGAGGGNGGGGSTGGGSFTTVNCSNQDANKIASALDAARIIADESYAYLNSPHNPTSQRYTEWFGVYSSSRWNTVESNFQAISDAMNNAAIEFDCGCNLNAYAYVYAGQAYTIYLCNAFWSAPTNGTDSKSGTLVHEMSHFNAVAGTDDVTYGQNSCRALADSSPSSATRNADSHEYFAENKPSLP